MLQRGTSFGRSSTAILFVIFAGFSAGTGQLLWRPLSQDLSAVARQHANRLIPLFLWLAPNSTVQQLQCAFCASLIVYSNAPILLWKYFFNLLFVFSMAVKPHTYTHPFNCPLSGTTRVSRCQKGKTNLDFTEARDSEWRRHQLGYMQVCTSLQT